MFQKSDGTMAGSSTASESGHGGRPLDREAVLATPTWHPAPGMPTSHLLIKVGTSFVPKTEIIGPGYHAAYGLVAMVHKQILSVNDKGEPDLMDLRIRTHGTPGYRTVKRGEEQRLPPAAQLRGPALGGLPHQAPRQHPRRPRA